MEEAESKSEKSNAHDATLPKTEVVNSSRETELQQQVQSLELENRKMQNEFNAQRAKLKDLFIQKEAEHTKCQQELAAMQRELDEMKSQFLVADLKQENEMHLKEMKAQEEISSLQQLVQDTIDDSTACKAELLRTREDYKRLWAENIELRESLQQLQQEATSSVSTGLAPQMLNQVKKTIARKLGGETATSILGESLDENVRAGRSVENAKQRLAQEDPEVLRSIVEQLQEEMKALKQKLREADEKIQMHQADLNKLDAYSSMTTESDGQHSSTEKTEEKNKEQSCCYTCHNYETKVQQLLKQATEYEEQLEVMQKNVEESRDALEKEAALRKDLEDQWQEKREAHKAEVIRLREQVREHQVQLLELQHNFLEAKEETTRQLQRLSDDRVRVNKQLETLQADNDFLSGRFLATVEDIENQQIDLPNTVEELQELILRQRNEMIQARVSSEFEKQKCVTSLDEIQILRGELETCNADRRAIKKQMQTEIKSLQHRISEHLVTLQKYETVKNALERKEAELNRQISELRVEIIELQENNEKLLKSNADYKAKIKILQDDLANGEIVQKDFVQLSQTLQMSLEKLRHADTDVRWQDDEDVTSCPTCSTYFTVTVRKIHCRHCGQIFCDKCLTKHVPSGPRKRNARVCDICHTLLTPNTAPYFSHDQLSTN